MVYESDFYTTRRPYRPSAYSVTAFPMKYTPTIGKVHTFTSYYPSHVPLRNMGMTRLVTSQLPPHHVITVRVRPSVVLRELDRIANRRRPALAYQPSEDFLCSESSKRWEDETRRIRAQTASLLQKVHSTVPRASSVVPFSTLTSYSDPYVWSVRFSNDDYIRRLLLPIRYVSSDIRNISWYSEPLVQSVRFANDDYIRRLLLPIRNVASDIRNISWYSSPASKFTGRGHLACINYSGNKAFSKRKPLCQDFTVRDDINLLSFYVKNRLAAAGLATESQTVKLLPWRPTRKFGKPQMMEDPALELKASKAERMQRFNATSKILEVDESEADKLADRKKKRQEEAKLVEERAILEEASRKKAQSKRDEEARAAELARQEELARQAAAERAAELERKAELARQAEEEEEEARRAEEERLAEEARQADEARLAAERAAEHRRAEEERRAEEDRRAHEEEEQRQKELARLEELERQAEEEKEAELARQAAELAEIARQEAELAALARHQAELDELARQEAELEELARQEAELAALDAEAKAFASGDDAAQADTSDEPEEPEVDEDPQPIVDEPATPDVQQDDEISEQDAEADVTGDEEE